MKDGYTPFLIDDYEIQNFQDVRIALPKYLCGLKGENVNVLYTAKSEFFSTYDFEEEVDTDIVILSLKIESFDYEISFVSGVPKVKIFDTRNKNVYAVGLAVNFVSGDNKKIAIGTETGAIYLSVCS